MVFQQNNVVSQAQKSCSVLYLSDREGLTLIYNIQVNIIKTQTLITTREHLCPSLSLGLHLRKIQLTVQENNFKLQRNVLLLVSFIWKQVMESLFVVRKSSWFVFMWHCIIINFIDVILFYCLKNSQDDTESNTENPEEEEVSDSNLIKENMPPIETTSQVCLYNTIQVRLKFVLLVNFHWELCMSLTVCVIK